MLGVMLAQQPHGEPLRPEQLRSFAEAAAGIGFAYVSMPDHVVGVDTVRRPDWNGAYDLDDPVREVLVVSGFLAAITSMQIVPSVLVLPQRQTVVVAKQAAELDLLTEGRFRLGVGVGWNAVEYGALGYRFTARGRRFTEQVEVLRRLWTSRSVSYAGEFHSLDGVGLWPLPIQRPIPLWFSGGPRGVDDGAGYEVLERAGRLADGWIARPLADATLVAHSTRTIGQAAERAGRDPSTIGIQASLRVTGEPELGSIPARLDAIRQAGATHITFDTTRARRPLAGQLSLLECIGETLATVYPELADVPQ